MHTHKMMTACLHYSSIHSYTCDAIESVVEGIETRGGGSGQQKSW